jgi:ketosteroid isomerase-like protein
MDNTLSSHLAAKLFEAMNIRDFSDLEIHIADDVALDFPGNGEVLGMKKVLLFLKVLLRKYPTLKFTVSEIIAIEDRACAVWTNKGTDTTGASYQNSGMTLIRFQNDKICFISDYFKDTSFVNNTNS